VIVGAGPGGLASAMLLASAGFDVEVVERRNRVGGRTAALEAEGFRFDIGPTFFLYPQILETIFAMCGRNLVDEVELIRLDPHYRLIFEGGGDIRATANVERMAAEIARISPTDAENLTAYLSDNRRKLSTFRPILENHFEGLGHLLRPSVLKSLAVLRPLSSVDADLGRHFDDPRVRLAFSFQSKYLGMSPFQCPSLFTILSFIEYEHGVFHPRGGCAAISEAMARVASELGVRIRLGEQVERVELEGRRVTGVRTNRDRYGADAIVINADFAQAMQKLVPDSARRRWTDRKLARKRYSCSTYMMYLGIKGRYEHLEHHTIFLSDEYRQNLADIEDLHVLSEDPSLYVQNPCVTDPGLAPEGHSTLYVLVPVTHQHENVDWAQAEPAFRERVFQQLDKLGLEDLRERIVFEKTLTPAGWEHDLDIYRGATFNLAHSLDQMLHLRPRNRFEDLEGCYLVGGGTHPGSGLPVIFESARISTRLLAEDLGVADPWATAGAAGTPGAPPEGAPPDWSKAARSRVTP
jgi:phytoene desaturase